MAVETDRARARATEATTSAAPAVHAAAVDRAPVAAVLGAPYRWTTIVILAGTIIGSMDSYIVNTSMPRVLDDLGQPVFYAWVASAFVLAQVVGLAVGGAWKDRSGLRVPFLVVVAAFGLGSLLCALAPSMSLLVGARALQGLAGGGLTAVGFAAAASYPEALRLRMFSLISGVWGAIALGAPLLGGLITDHWGWRWIFLVNVPLCALVLALAWVSLKDATSGDGRRSLPVGRAVLLAVAVGGLVATPSASPLAALPLLAIGVGAAVLYARLERKAEVPVIPTGTWLGRGAVGSCLLATMFYTAAYVGAGVFLPLYLVQVRGVSTTEAGLVLSIGGSLWTVGSIVAGGHSAGPWPRRMVLGGALLIALAGASIAAQSALGQLPLALIYLTWGAAGFGIGLAMIHLMNWAIVFSPPSQSGAASGAVQTARMLGSAAGGALMGALLNAIGSDPEHLQLSITAIFLLVCGLALVPATVRRPSVRERSIVPAL